MLNWANPWTEPHHHVAVYFQNETRHSKNIWRLKQKDTQIFLSSSKLQNISSVHSGLHTVNPLIWLLVFLVVVTRDPTVKTAIPLAISKATAPEKNHDSIKPQTNNEVCCLWNKHQRPPCISPDRSCRYGRLHNCNTCSKKGYIDLNHTNTHPPLANS